MAETYDNRGGGYTYFDCECSDFGHVIRFSLDHEDGSLWLEAHMCLWLPWYRRVWHAIRYVFGYPRLYGHYDITLLRNEDYDRLKALLDRSAHIKLQAAHGGPSEKPVLNG